MGGNPSDMVMCQVWSRSVEEIGFWRRQSLVLPMRKQHVPCNMEATTAQRVMHFYWMQQVVFFSSRLQLTTAPCDHYAAQFTVSLFLDCYFRDIEIIILQILLAVSCGQRITIVDRWQFRYDKLNEIFNQIDNVTGTRSTRAILHYLFQSNSINTPLLCCFHPELKYWRKGSLERRSGGRQWCCFDAAGDNEWN